MEKEGKMLINKEQNQVYMQKRDIITQPPFILTMSNFCPLLNSYFRSLSNELSNFGRERLKNLLYEYKSFSFNLCDFQYG